MCERGKLLVKDGHSKQNFFLQMTTKLDPLQLCRDKICVYDEHPLAGKIYNTKHPIAGQAINMSVTYYEYIYSVVYCVFCVLPSILPIPGSSICFICYADYSDFGNQFYWTWWSVFNQPVLVDMVGL